VRIDTHGSAVCPEVWQLFQKVIDSLGSLPAMIERDQNLPPFGEIEEESRKLHTILEASIAPCTFPSLSDELHGPGKSLENADIASLSLSQTASWPSLAHSLFQGITTEDQESLSRLESLLLDKSPTPARVGWDVYRHGYKERLLEALGEQIPTFAAVTGRHTLRHLLGLFLEEYPPSSYSVDHSLVDFAFFLENLAKYSDSPLFGNTEVDQLAFIELARLEQTLYHQIFQEGELERSMSSQDLVELLQTMTMEDFLQLRFKICNSVKIMSFAYDLVSVVDTFKKSRFTTLPRKRSTHIVIFKQEGIATTKRVPKWQADFLSEIGNQQSFYDVLEKAKLNDPQKMPKALHCLGYWCQLGVFQKTALTAPEV
jgi:hypothetical protein